MASLRDLRKRLRAVKNTQKITKAMKMVAASKLRRAQQQVIEARPFAAGMQDVLDHVVSRSDIAGHELMKARKPSRVEIVVMTSNRGLCGGFNSSIIRAVEKHIAENEDKHDEILLSCVGKKGAEHFIRKGWDLTSRHDEIWDDLSYEQASDLATSLAARFTARRLDAVYLVYNELKSAISQKVVLQQLLPVLPLDNWEEDEQFRIGEMAPFTQDLAQMPSADEVEVEIPEDWKPSPDLEVARTGFEHVFEPSREEVLDALIPQHLTVQVWRALLESIASEHGARMAAMDAASTNAKELIEKITLQANRLRQAGITNELMEIVSGAESLTS